MSDQLHEFGNRFDAESHRPIDEIRRCFAEPRGFFLTPRHERDEEALVWLGKPRRTQAEHSMHLVYSFEPEEEVGAKMKLKVEINTREHVPFAPTTTYPFRVDSRWYGGDAEIVSYQAHELFGTKLRALLQRDKNRDLFDLGEGLEKLPLKPDQVVDSLRHYLGQQGATISRANAEERMLGKLRRSLTNDIAPLLPSHVEYPESKAIRAFGRVWTELIARLPGDSWKRSSSVIEKLRETSIPERSVFPWKRGAGGRDLLTG